MLPAFVLHYTYSVCNLDIVLCTADDNKKKKQQLSGRFFLSLASILLNSLKG